MTVTHRKRVPDEILTINEPSVQIECDSCARDLTHSIRIKCADPACELGDGVDICPTCFCNGKEFAKHKRSHSYRVVELHSYPIFSEDWGADEELLLIEGLALQGFGNWQAIAERVGTRTKEEVEQHYNAVYVDSPDWPLPSMDLKFDIDISEFQDRKRRRISALQNTPVPPLKQAPTSTPGIHEIAGFLPGRLEFEHELDNEAEDLVKDLEFGICLEWGGDAIPEDENDPDVKARAKWLEERTGGGVHATKGSSYPVNCEVVVDGLVNGRMSLVNGNEHAAPVNGHATKSSIEENPADNGSTEGEGNAEEITHPLPLETNESLQFKLALIEAYCQRVQRRRETKAVIYDRGLLEHKKMQAAEKRRPKDEKDIIHRLRPFTRLQTAEDFEAFSADILYEAVLRKRIQDLQHYRRMGLVTAADIDKYEQDCAKRAQIKANLSRDYYTSERLHLRTVGGRSSSGPDPRRVGIGGDSESRKSDDRELTPKLVSNNIGAPVIRKPPQPLNLANSPSLHLLTPAEQTLCSQLRILPKPYLVIKETLVREYARRGGKLRRREARDLVKIDVNKTSRVWDFLVQAGFLKIAPEPTATSTSTADSTAGSLNQSPSKELPRPLVNGTPSTSTSSSIPSATVSSLLQS